MSRAIMLQNRLAIIEQRYGDAIERFRMIYQLGQNTNELGFLVTHLVGVAHVNIANDGIKLLIASEDSPNLYWALAEVEVPDSTRSLRLDSSIPLRVFPELMNADKANYAKDEWKRILRKITAETGMIGALVGAGPAGKASPADQTGALALGWGLAGYTSAKTRMIERGYSEEAVNKMGVAEVLLRDAAIDIKQLTQEIETAFYLPRKDAIARASAWEEKMAKMSPTRVGALLTGMLAPAFVAILNADTKTQAELNALMAIESLRNHAATNGSFPESLEELELPVRNNPFTERPFNYVLEGEKAVLTYETNRNQIERYEITLKR